MQWDDDRLSDIFNKTDGDCTYCEKQLSWNNHGYPEGRGAWEVDHSIPLSRGGTHHLNNLVPACRPCNQVKSNMTASEFRRAIQPREVVVEGPGWGWVVGGLFAVALLGAAAGRGPRGPPPPYL